MMYSFTCLDHSKIDQKCSLTGQPCIDRYRYKHMLPKVVKHTKLMNYSSLCMLLVKGIIYRYGGTCPIMPHICMGRVRPQPFFYTCQPFQT